MGLPQNLPGSVFCGSPMLAEPVFSFRRADCKGLRSSFWNPDQLIRTVYFA